MKNIEHECAYRPPGQSCKRQVLLWDFKEWRARLDELKTEFKTVSRCGSSDKQEVLLEQMKSFNKVLDTINLDFQETNPSKCKNCPCPRI